MELMISDVKLGDSLYSASIEDKDLKLLFTVEWHEPVDNIEFGIKTLDMAILNVSRDINNVEKSLFDELLNPYGIIVNSVSEFAPGAFISRDMVFIDDSKKESLIKLINRKCKSVFKAQPVNYNF